MLLPKKASCVTATQGNPLLFLIPALVLGCGSVAASAIPDQPPSLRVGYSATPIKLNDALSDPQWAQATVIKELRQQSPDPDGSTPFRTRVLLLRDDKTLYIRIVATDPNPERIVAHSLVRDTDQSGDDHITLVLDTFAQHRDAYVFQINAGGARTDGLLSPAASSPSLDWNGIWYAAVRRTGDGWMADIAIPVSSLRFSSSDCWGFNVERYVPRKQLILTWAGHTLDSSVYQLQREGTTCGLAGFKRGSGLRITPYALAEYDSQPRDTHGKGGVTASYDFSPALTGILTFNPDFSEAEAQSLQINLTPYALYLPENRSFFTEGSNFFTFGSGLADDIIPFYPFYSRQVGLVNGAVVPIDGGAKLVGQSGALSIGALDIQTASSGASSAQNLLAGRIAYALDSELQVGGLVTHGDPTGLTHNTFYGGDINWNTSTFQGDKNLSLGAWGGRTIDSGLQGRDTAWGYRLDYPNDLWQFGYKYSDFGSAFYPALGFLPENGIHQTKAYMEYDPRPQDNWVRQFFFQIYAHYITDSQGRLLTGELFTAPFNADSQSGAHYEFDWIPQMQQLFTPFAITGDISIPPGRYRYTRYRVEAQSPPAYSWQVGGSYEGGPFYDGRLHSVTSFVKWSSATGHAAVGFNIEDDFGYLAVGHFVQRLYGLQLTYSFTPDVTFSNLAQYDTNSNLVQFNEIFRWTIEPGSDLYVVFNHDVAQLTNASPGGVPRSTGNQFIIKLEWTFRGSAP